METVAIVLTVFGVVVFIVLIFFLSFFIFKKFYQGRSRRPFRKRCKGKDYSSAQSQIRKKDATIQEVHVKRLTKCIAHPAGDPDVPSLGPVNQPPGPGDIFILPDPPPPADPRP